MNPSFCQLSEAQQGAEGTGGVEENAGRKSEQPGPDEKGAADPPKGGKRGRKAGPIQLS